MTDSSEKSLVKKLGFTPGDSVYVETTPDWYTQFAEDNDLELEPGRPTTHAHLFCSTESDLAAFLHENELPQIEKSLWISWPKKSGNKRTNLSENDVRNVILPLGWVDTKVASIDDDWSGLKFVRRKA